MDWIYRRLSPLKERSCVCVALGVGLCMLGLEKTVHFLVRLFPVYIADLYHQPVPLGSWRHSVWIFAPASSAQQPSDPFSK